MSEIEALPPDVPRRFLRLALAFLLAAVAAGIACAAEYHQAFDGPQTSWTVRFDPAKCRLLSHSRHPRIVREGTGSENVQIEVASPVLPVELEHPLPPSVVLNQLTLGVWVRSNRAGPVVALRVVFPHQKDARTGEPAVTLISGDAYTDAGSWQLLTCRTSDTLMQDAVRRLRHKSRELRLQPDVDTRGMYVDRALLTFTAGKGTTELFIDELKLSGVVPPQAGNQLPVSEADDSAAPAVEMRLDRLLVNGQTFFPRMIPYHEESPESLARAGCNPIWIPDPNDGQLLAELRNAGLWGMATPPSVTSTSGDLLNAARASLTPFDRDTDPILFWNLGTGVTPQQRDEFVSWREQLMSADRRMNRPLVADVTGLERVFSRLIPMMGVTRNMQHTSFTYLQYRDWLLERQSLSRPGTFVWTWLQTEPSEATAARRAAARKIPIVIEPEQIELQAYAALSAGLHGLGFWTTTPLHSQAPGARERELVITQLNLELQLLEEWLATGKLIGHKRFNPVFTDPDPTTAASDKDKNVRLAGVSTQASNGQFAEGTAAQKAERRRAAERERFTTQIGDDVLEAAILRTDHGLLLLPVWYGRDAQFVPGQMAANDVTIVVEGVEETATAWLITTTQIHSLKHRPTAGGMEITLPLFEIAAAVIVTSDFTEIERLRQRMGAIQEKSAQTALALAAAKLERVRGVDRELRALGVGQADGDRILASAQSLLEEAGDHGDRQEYHKARQKSADCRRVLRILQRAHWEAAIEKLSDPVSSPHTVCFQTLPDHWRMIRQIGSASLSMDDNLLKSGDFEDGDTIRAEGWGHAQHKVPGVRAAAELYPLPERDNYCLRLVAAPAAGPDDPPRVINERPVTVSTPGVTVRSGQIVHINGWARVVTDISGSLDGVLIYDSLTGPEGAIRWQTAGEWRRFSLIREIQTSGELKVIISLAGLGEVQLDDLQIVPQAPAALPTMARAHTPAPPAATPRPGFAPNLNLRLPKPGYGQRARSPAGSSAAP